MHLPRSKSSKFQWDVLPRKRMCFRLRPLGGIACGSGKTKTTIIPRGFKSHYSHIFQKTAAIAVKLLWSKHLRGLCDTLKADKCIVSQAVLGKSLLTTGVTYTTYTSTYVKCLKDIVKGISGLWKLLREFQGIFVINNSLAVWWG